MSETLRINCPCGYENWVPAEKLGQTVACFVCGEDLHIQDLANTNDDPETKSTPTSIQSAPSIDRPRSPFEDDEPEPTARPKFQQASQTPAPASPPTARPRNPFEADNAENASPFRPGTEQNFVADPFSRELIPAPKPAPSTADEMEKHRPTDRRARHTFIDTISPHDAPTGEKCMQCGRPIRGSWDRVETHLGVFCYVCSNQATHDVPDRVKSGSGKNELRERDMLVDPVDIRNAAPLEQNTGVTGAPGFKKFILWMAWGVLAIAFIVWLTGWGGSTTYTPSSTDDPTQVVPVPDFIRYIGWGVRLCGGFLGAVLALYLTLDRHGDLPHKSFMLNFINLGAGVVLLMIVLLGITFINVFFIDDPLVGIMFNVLATFVFIGAAFYILTGWFDFGPWDYVRLAFFYMPIVQFLVQGVGYFLIWGLHTWIV